MTSLEFFSLRVKAQDIINFYLSVMLKKEKLIVLEVSMDIANAMKK